MKLMKQPIWLLLTAMTFSAVILLVSAGNAVRSEKSAAAARAAVLREYHAGGYVLREADGHLALYRENEIRPYRILEAEVWLLPEEDRKSLAEGIHVRTEQELRILLEDWDAENS